MNPTILITGAGGAAAVSIMKALRGAPLDVLAADMDPNAAGLYLVPQEDRFILPHASSPGFVRAVQEICARRRVHALIPTVDAELLPLAAAVGDFYKIGTRVMTAPEPVLKVVLDKFKLVCVLDGIIPVPATHLLGSNADLSSWTGKCITKPRRGAGSRGISLLEEVPASPDPDPSMLIQEYLPGAEYSVDVLADRQGRVLSAVPRERLKVDSGVAVAARVVRDAELEHFATLAVERLGLPFISNVQFRRNSMGVPCLLEINPRTPGTMPLTVASGVNMPLLALRALLGHVTDAEVPAFKEVATVRYWTERFITPDEMSALTVQSEVAA